MASTPRTRRSAVRRAAALVSAATAAGTLAGAPAAVAAPEEIVARSTGLSAPTGVVETPDGARWVADELLGVCRVEDGGAGLARDLYCSDAEAGEPHAGPVSSAGLAFDAATSSFYAGDIQSGEGAIWRLRWDAATGTIGGATRVASLGEDRVTGVALAPGQDGAPASVVFTLKGSTAVMRLANPAAGPGTPAAA
ncbi:MAG TPA: hypothetical protein VN213_10555, partial [Solirubrobacteraceae bacterium]|nr:hypothetical protein [Solirubrobacteraceae bacterium]